MKLWRWEYGRQNTGYKKLLLLRSKWLLKFDCYILKFSEGVEIPAHIDTVDSGRHYRLNVILKSASLGGQFHCDTCLFETTRIKLFRPDLYLHSVSKVEAGSRLVLSIGWVKDN